MKAGLQKVYLQVLFTQTVAEQNGMQNWRIKCQKRKEKEMVVNTHGALEMVLVSETNC